MSPPTTAAPACAVLLVIPAFRESLRLPGFLPPLLTALRDAAPATRVLVVDDGSPAAEREATFACCAALAKDFPALLPPLPLPVNLGKGGAVYAGWRTDIASPWLGFCDADGSVPPAEIVRLIATLPAGPAGAVIASRHAGGPRPVSRTFVRGVLSRLFSAFVRAATRLPVRDSQCGCKFVRRDDFEAVYPLFSERRFAFDVELLLRLSSRGVVIREEPVAWAARPGGSLAVFRDGLRMLGAVARLGRLRRR